MPNGMPYGDAFIVGTPHIDRVSQQLYAEQRQREALRQQQMAQMDEEFRKNVSNIRDADVPDFTQKYQDWKRSRQDLMKMPQTDQNAYIQKQMESQRKLADLYQLANASKIAKGEEEQLYKGIASKPNDFSDDAYTLLTNRRKAPLSTLKQYQYTDPNTGQTQVVDLTNPDTYRFKGVDFDLSKLLKDAKGIPRQTYTKEEPVSGDNLQTKLTPYYFGNSPMDYKNQILGGLYTRNGGRFAERQFDEMNPDMVNAINDQFKKLPKEKWQQMTGSDTPQDLIIKDTDSKAEKYAKHLAQLYAINENPEIRTAQFKTNEAEKLRMQSNLTEGRENRLIQARKAAGAYNYGNGANSGQQVGNAFDAMKDVVKDNYFIQGGTWYNKNGNPVDTGGGQTFISKQEIPATWLSTLKSGGLPIDKISDGVYATIKDGKIQSIYNKQIGTVTRQQMEGVYQLKMDTEPLKGQHLQFAQNGNSESVPPKTWKHNYINPKTKQKAHSDDGINWFDDNGKPIK